MTNYEKYVKNQDELIKRTIADRIAFDLRTNEVVSCLDLQCNNCGFAHTNGNVIGKCGNMLDWLNSTAVPFEVGELVMFIDNCQHTPKYFCGTCGNNTVYLCSYYEDAFNKEHKNQFTTDYTNIGKYDEYMLALTKSRYSDN